MKDIKSGLIVGMSYLDREHQFISCSSCISMTSMFVLVTSGKIEGDWRGGEESIDLEDDL